MPLLHKNISQKKLNKVLHLFFSNFINMLSLVLTRQCYIYITAYVLVRKYTRQIFDTIFIVINTISA